MTESQRHNNTPSPAPVPPEIAAVPSIAVGGGTVGDVVPKPIEPFGTVHSDFAAFHAEYISTNIDRADTKAIWAFAVASGLLAYLLSNEAMRLLFQAWTVQSFVFALVLLCLLLSALCSFLVVMPRLGTSGEKLVYFGAVAIRPNADAYVEDIRTADLDSLTRARVTHCYDLSKVCVLKYKRLGAAVWLGATAFLGFLFLLLVT